MGRHRSDPLGIARLALAGLAALLLLALIVVGARALFGALSDDSTTSGPPSSSASAATRIPTLQIVCAAASCPVFVRVPGGDVLTDRDLTRDEQVSYFEPELDVVLEDAGAVQTLENGVLRDPAPLGERETFKVVRAPGP